jgi:hypothetical protein
MGNAHPAVRIARASFAQYGKKAGGAVLLTNLDAACAMLDPQVPPPVREVIVWARCEVEKIIFLAGVNGQAKEVDRVWSRVRDVFLFNDAL